MCKSKPSKYIEELKTELGNKFYIEYLNDEWVIEGLLYKDFRVMMSDFGESEIKSATIMLICHYGMFDDNPERGVMLHAFQLGISRDKIVPTVRKLQSWYKILVTDPSINVFDTITVPTKQ